MYDEPLIDRRVMIVDFLENPLPWCHKPYRTYIILGEVPDNRVRNQILKLSLFGRAFEEREVGEVGR